MIRPLSKPPVIADEFVLVPDYESGDRLPNGAFVLDFESGARIVVAHNGGYHPFVTWRVDDCGRCSEGTYHETLSAAVRTFEERIGRI